MTMSSCLRRSDRSTGRRSFDNHFPARFINMSKDLSDWDKSTSSLPSMSSYQNSEAAYHQPHQSFYHHSNISTTSLVPAHSSREDGAPPAERETFLDSDSDCSTSNAQVTPPVSVRRAVIEHATACPQRWPFIDFNDEPNNDCELDYPEIDTLGPLGTVLHEFDHASSELEAGSDDPLVRLREHSIRNLRAQWMKRCQTLGERRIMKTVEQGCGKVGPAPMVQAAQSAEVVGLTAR